MTAASETASPPLAVSAEPEDPAPTSRDREADPAPTSHEREGQAAVSELNAPHDQAEGGGEQAETPRDHREAEVAGSRGRALATLRRAWDSPLPRALRCQTLTAPGGVLLALLVLLPGVLIDAATDGTLGQPTVVTFVLAGLACALTVRTNALGTAAFLPPLLFATAATLIAWASGQNHTTRQLVLDAGTTLALSAPAIFTGTGLVLLVVLGRVGWSLLRRR